ncbi:MAG: Iron(3+)-hydroxamate-binding protein FhuD [Stenotrophomonas maltophilia]|nr:MAG: Iron(3+)-hydroxamate-binding protein FhuD [Stenotrophomonas maltophilia]
MRRRALLQAAALAPCLALAGPRPPRIVVLDWGLAETLLALGVVPLGVAEIDSYHASVVTPRLPSQVVDVGLRLAPSLELLQRLAPELILINSSQTTQRELLQRIAPVLTYDVYNQSGTPYRNAQAVTLELGRLCGCAERAAALVAACAQALEQARARIDSARRQRPVYLLQFFDPRHIGVYGPRSLFQDLFVALGLRNAWDGPSDYWGIAVAGVERLAAQPQADLLCLAPLPAGVAEGLAHNPLWQSLPAVREGRAFMLPAFWGFGMLPSAQRFAASVATALGAEGRA